MEKLNFEKGNGLIPVIVQDDQSRKVLMLGYMNQESLQKTRESGMVTFYSRSRQELWTKGETSGNGLHVKKILVDCDQDTLLIMAHPDGPVCHDGPDTCFNEINDSSLIFLEHLEAIIQERQRTLPEGSYTSTLFKDGTSRIARKVGEEAIELLIEALGGEDERFLNEAADLIYHLQVLLVDRGFSLKDVVNILSERHA